MRNFIICLIAILLCNLVLTTKVGETAYRLSLYWPISKIGGQPDYTKEDFPLFKGDNFAIKLMYAIENSTAVCNPKQCPPKPLNVGKIQQKDYDYLQKYFYRFGLDGHSTTKQLWNKYGSCYSSQTQYFTDLVKIHKKFNIVKTLESYGIVPDKERAYSIEAINEALGEIFGDQVPQFHCYPGKVLENGFTGPQILKQIDIYLDKNLKTTPDNYKQCIEEMCTGYLLYLPLEF